MSKPKKILNDPSRVVTELLDGLVLASDGRLVRLEGRDAIVRSQIPNDKVALLIGGGSGHEPMFPGFIGENLADGAACGQVFAAPAPDLVLAATQAVNRGRGVLYVYGNYAGDNMNFDIGAELAADEGINVRTVRVWDDVAGAPPERIADRRGIAGDFYVIKIAGGAAATVDSLDEAYRIAAKARDNTRSMGVAIAAGSIPETGALTFELGPDEIEIGMGAHGEPGHFPPEADDGRRHSRADDGGALAGSAVPQRRRSRVADQQPRRHHDDGAAGGEPVRAEDSRQGGDCGPSHRYRLVSDVSGDGRPVDHAAAARR